MDLFLLEHRGTRLMQSHLQVNLILITLPARSPEIRTVHLHFDDRASRSGTRSGFRRELSRVPSTLRVQVLLPRQPSRALLVDGLTDVG